PSRALRPRPASCRRAPHPPRLPSTPPFRSQGRVVADNILGTDRRAAYTAIPRVVFAHPEIAAVGLTEEQAHEQGLDPVATGSRRSEEHTSELQSRFDLVCRLLLEKKRRRAG